MQNKQPLCAMEADSFKSFLQKQKSYPFVDTQYIELVAENNQAAQLPNDVRLLKHFLRVKKPKKVLEIGVLLGGGTLHFFDELAPDAQLYSVDLEQNIVCGNAPSRPTGCLALQTYDQTCHPVWKTYFGKDITECLTEIGPDIDFVLIDTVHLVPGEILAYLSILHNLADNCVLMLHDIGLAPISTRDAGGKHGTANAYCSHVLFSAIMSQFKYFSQDIIPNMGAVVIEKEKAMQSILNVVSLLFLPWEYMPPVQITERVCEILQENYPEVVYKTYAVAVNYNMTLHNERGQLKIFTPFMLAAKEDETGYAGNICLNVQTEAAFKQALEKVKNCRFSTKPEHLKNYFHISRHSNYADCSLTDYAYRAELLRLRPLLSDDEFEPLLHNPIWNADTLFRTVFLKKYENKLRTQAERLHGQKVYFWGAGWTYQQYKDIFAGLCPQKILINNPTSPEIGIFVDSLEVAMAEDVLGDNNVLPIVIFAGPEHMMNIIDFIEKNYPAHSGDNLLLCWGLADNFF